MMALYLSIFIQKIYNIAATNQILQDFPVQWVMYHYYIVNVPLNLISRYGAYYQS